MEFDKEKWEATIRKAENLTRKKDFLHLLLSYPMKPEQDDTDVSFKFLMRQFSRMNQLRREIQDLLSGYRYGNELGEVFAHWIDVIHVVEKVLGSYDFHMVAYLPQEADNIITTSSDESLTHTIEVGLTRGQANCCTIFEAPAEIKNLAINSAVRQVTRCFESGNFRKIGISGAGGIEVAKALKDNASPQVRINCGRVFQVSVSQYHNTKDVRKNIAEQVGGFEKKKIDDAKDVRRFEKIDDNFLLLVDCGDRQIDLHDLNIPDHGFLVLTTQSQKIYEIMELDLEIRMEDHLLPWELFCRNVGRSLINSSSTIQQMAVQLVKQCHGHLLATILLARALKDVTYIGVWERTLNHTFVPTPRGLHQFDSLEYDYDSLEDDDLEFDDSLEDVVMNRVVELIWDQKDIITKHCIKNYCKSSRVQKFRDSLVSDWILNGIVETETEGKGILEDLINSFLVENVGKDYVRMREETKTALGNHTKKLPSIFQWQGRLKKIKTTYIQDWKAKKIEFINDTLWELPENHKCPDLKILWLHTNYNLMEIPQLFFRDMPLLRSLNLSYTSIKSLPPSISSLYELRRFYLIGCELLTELPPQIGALGKLEVLDLEGTKIMCLPKEIGELIRLRRFNVSLYREMTIPTGVLSKLSQLKELRIHVSPDGEWWDADVKSILNELNSLEELETLELYLPSIQFLQQLRRDNTRLMYPYLSQFKFTVGHHPQSFISRLPHEVEMILKNWEKSNKCLKYINGEGMPNEIIVALSHSSVFFLDRQWTIKVLSEFGNENMIELKFCLLVECHELQTIIDGDYQYPLGVPKKPVFRCLEYLGIHYMKNLQSIWKGPIDGGCLSNLKFLALHTCPNLTTIFTSDLLCNLKNLEELIVEDCSKINNLVNDESAKYALFPYKLKKISLLYLPELVTISGGLLIGFQLESLIVYDCPKFECLHRIEVSCTRLKIKGEKEWWDALKWNELEWSTTRPTFKQFRSEVEWSMTRPTFEQFRSDEDLMDQLAKDVYSTFNR